MMRNSREFPKWLNAPETKEKLKGKKVMMCCTGGIRCERATALLSQMERAEDELQTQGIYHVRGGIDRYLKTFPEGGYWKGRNYLSDLRGEQENWRKKPDEVVNTETANACKDSYCCVCKDHYALYKGKHVCSNKECKVPVIVCDRCRKKRRRSSRASSCASCASGVTTSARCRCRISWDKSGSSRWRRAPTSTARRSARRRDLEPARWVHVGKLPLTITADQVCAPRWRGMTGAPGMVEWIADRDTGFFYGSAYVGVSHARGRRARGGAGAGGAAEVGGQAEQGQLRAREGEGPGEGGAPSAIGPRSQSRPDARRRNPRDDLR